MAALTAFLLDVALRRIDFSLWFGRGASRAPLPRPAAATAR